MKIVPKGKEYNKMKSSLLKKFKGSEDVIIGKWVKPLRRQGGHIIVVIHPNYRHRYSAEWNGKEWLNFKLDMPL